MLNGVFKLFLFIIAAIYRSKFSIGIVYFDWLRMDNQMLGNWISVFSSLI